MERKKKKITFGFDPSNDYSRKGIKTATELGVPLNEAPVVTDSITMYVDGKQVWGIAPDGSKPETEPDKPAPNNTTTEKPKATTAGGTTSTVMYGDVNCDQSVDVADVVLLSRIAVEDTTANVTAQGMKNADCNLDTKTDLDDCTMILRYIAKLIPYSKLGSK